MFFSWNTSQGIHEVVDTDGSNFIIIIIKILVCVCLYIMRFYLRALVQSLQTSLNQAMFLWQIIQSPTT